ncbi:hypothetical protein PPEP_a0574 [Pseudoalteromonas peptidolytica F12-50-A1]|uniref:Uncharacterized protein n=1 Tax=Pseudoalteromonas peptidolytica F12-50-A1 TaxID=1315280 RepID=A0A8I0MUM9_9GAMM|nr:hypothetical protein [Pseudoalteromonas peptidolytica F12-50-A1]
MHFIAYFRRLDANFEKRKIYFTGTFFTSHYNAKKARLEV